jgi:FlaA1/EpsC-like NDP-sugar epimerase
MSILITGGTGSFGRAFIARWLSEGHTGRLCIYSRGEHAQASARVQFEDNASLRWFIGDVRDRDRLRRAFDGVDTVIHAAALKRIEVGAYNPIEMVKTNVDGAKNVIEAAMDANVRRVVALSSDKAYQPISPYGQTKALMEGLMLAANNTSGVGGTRFAVTRYGNVAGSAGSVIPLWREQLKDSDTVTVTNPECTRFWMTMDEAIDLVLQTRHIMPEEIAIPTLPGFRLGDLADAMGAKMAIRGLPEWEKKHEGLSHGQFSNTAKRMSVSELREALERV